MKMNKSLFRLILMVALTVILIVTFSNLVNSSKEIHITFNTEVTSQTAQALVKKLNSAGEDDIIHLYVNSPGGSLFSGYTILSAMQTTKAKIVYHVDGIAASMAAVMLCYADEVVLSDYSLIMFHTVQVAGKAVTIKNMQSSMDAALLKSLILSIKRCSFLTSGEFNTILNLGGEVWLTGEELKERLSK